MRKLAILTFTTLDGVMQAPKLKEEDTSDGFDLGGWADKYWDEVMEQVGKEAMAVPYDLLLGRKTYELFAKHNATGGNDNPLNHYQKYVITKTLKNLSWKNAIPLAGDVLSEITKLKSQEGPLIQVHGSWQLIDALFKHDLVDELRLWTFPVVLGRGKRLFNKNGILNTYKLVKSAPTSNGVVMNIYQKP